MSEIQDLKNHVTAMSLKINQVVGMMQNCFTVNDRINELLGLMHQIGLTNQNKNNDIFDCILPDFVRRITAVESHINTKKKDSAVGEHMGFYIGKGKKKRKVHMLIREDGVSFYVGKQSLFVEL